MNWVIKKFDALTAKELYAILQLRSEVFVVEQNCIFQDMDNKDQYSHHIMCWHEGQLVATARLVPAGISYKAPSIGRVVSSKAVRGNGTGQELMKIAIDEMRKLYGNTAIKIGAQFYLKKFYSSLGFEQTSEIYLEDGIEHIEMVMR
ncbi:MAG: GNAT family N-acetyltransferase [Chitinophagaceae bacterium]|nr:GNAT family N-acetyltransferase [Chitinophagaceae bacterium]MBK8952282.1 GNAT family N-acetyltransferase [Chitinophagaceae bacterium]